MLLKADHLMSAMAIKLGPALKICSAIDAMREELKQVKSYLIKSWCIKGTIGMLSYRGTTIERQCA